MKKNYENRSWLDPVLKKILLAMKLATVIILISIMHVSASVYSQTTKLSLSMQETTIKEVLQKIESMSEFRFIYQNEKVDLNTKVNVQFKNESVEHILDEIFKKREVEYSITENNLILIKSGGEASNKNRIDSEFIEQKTISGKVTDSSGLPLPGVTVVVKGTTQGTVTNEEGEYNLINVPAGATIQFSFVGMITQELAIGDQTNIDLVMEADAIGIEEVVAVGYGTMRKSDLTGSVMRANNETIKQRPNISVLQSLRGSLPGLNVGQVSQAGEEPDFSIRGRTSISGQGTPLIVVDGVIFRGSLNDINPNDIKSVDVLKDASSAAIYGSQASNGVVIITTNDGENTEGKPTINFSSFYSFNEPAKDFKLESPEEFMTRMANADLFNSRTEESGYLEPNLDYNPTSEFRTNEQVDAYNNGQTTDWKDLLTNDRMASQGYNLSISNRTNRSGYFISAGFSEEAGYMINENYSRWNTRINIDNSVTSWLDVGIQSFMTASDYSGYDLSPSEIFKQTPYSPAFKEDGSYVENANGLDINPLYLKDTDDFDKKMNLFGNVYADIKLPFIKGLSFKTNYNRNYRIENYYIFKIYGNSFQGSGSKRHEIFNNWANDNILSYKNVFNRKHKVDITLVQGYEKRAYSATEGASKSFITDVLGYNSLQSGSSELQSVTTQAWEEQSVYSMGRVFYGYDNKYLFTGTIRRDGFSGFSTDNKFGVFPSMSFAWVASEESFLKEELPWLDLLKVRVSYGSNGNRTIGRYQTLARVAGTFGYLDENGTSLYKQAINKLASPNLKWETTTGINFGIDFAILNQRLFGAVEYYSSNTEDLLYNVDIPGISRYETFPDNLGKLANHGFEMSLSSINVSNQTFRWESSVTFSMNRNELKELLGRDDNGDGVEDDLVSEGLFIGESLNAIYTYETDGSLWQMDDDIPSTATLGSYKIINQDDDETITPDDRKIIGTTDPLFRLGMNNKVKYKNWLLTFFINSVVGNDNYYLGTDNMTGFNAVNSQMLYTRTFPSGLDYWLPENPNAKYQKLLISVPSGLQASPYIPRTFIRLQDVMLSYNFDSEFLKRIEIQNLKLYFNGKNLYTITKWPGWDPETGQGITMGGRPVTRSYSFGIELTF
ncbi:TonB-dependent receptor [Maribellus maritimus]|uniref:TonB-dependent receptor n=1 Tax=Maribellus maritimus TaxID=2870838 RepID=UPI001EEADD9B|nr:TonB-dependent receptor [Maribellus maritimus]MCG6187851.1 TonB-dependent receptor [Maribellus maritimus]